MSKKYVLIVDDDPDLVETVCMMLEDKGYEVGKAYDGVEGEEAIKERHPTFWSWT
jgi:DNA-binding response OmpR family regulator